MFRENFIFRADVRVLYIARTKHRTDVGTSRGSTCSTAESEEEKSEERRGAAARAARRIGRRNDALPKHTSGYYYSSLSHLHTHIQTQLLRHKLPTTTPQ